MLNIDFIRAKTAHISWRTQILDFLDGKSKLTLSEVVSHNHCELGKWIYSEGLKKYGHLPAMSEVEQVHKQLHESMRMIVTFYEKNEFEKAEQEYETMCSISEHLLALIDNLQQVYQADALYLK
ncbi:MAG: CZB domain-containing protein [Microscillaceae bacterium]|nr:CZB domain-containing protein [Microscillaceae bacterium]MDW8461557.1 CZB domain-containing protein [Cytophagales bacterium]